MGSGPQMYLHYGTRTFTPEAYLKAKNKGELGAVVHADGSKTLLSGQVMAPEQAKRADEAIAGTQDYNNSLGQGPTDPDSDGFPAPTTLTDPLLSDPTDPDLVPPDDDVTPFTLEELQEKAQVQKIKGRALMGYDTLLARLYPVQP